MCTCLRAVTLVVVVCCRRYVRFHDDGSNVTGIYELSFRISSGSLLLRLITYIARGRAMCVHDAPEVSRTSFHLGIPRPRATPNRFSAADNVERPIASNYELAVVVRVLSRSHVSFRNTNDTEVVFFSQSFGRSNMVSFFLEDISWQTQLLTLERDTGYGTHIRPFSSQN